MSELILIRHGETALAGTFCGHSDPSLNERGRAQAAALAESLAGSSLKAIYTSDLQRARQTAEALATTHGLPMRCDSALREINFGRWEALRWSEIEAQDATYAARWMAEFPQLPAPGGEPFAAFEQRVVECVETIVQDAPMPVAIVSHGGVMRVVLERLFGYAQHEAWELTKEYGCVIHCPPVQREAASRSDALPGQRASVGASVSDIK
ncbi:MAG: alpha-ribazole phosphatase [Acidobacteria bacterium]|nr:alpha-ribazole phosphatase [Acidobacteriota bacterium]